MYAQEFSRLSTELLKSIEELKRLGPAYNEKLQRIADNVETGSFTLAVIGQFKRGKTTLVNAILGESLLPTAVLPLTSIITRIRYGPRRKIVVVHENGESSEIPAEDIPLYVTERHNPKNVRKVSRVEVELPSEFLRHGVVIVDTPGIGSTHLHNSEVAYRFLPEADAVIFVLSGDPPITELECSFIEESRKYASKFFFVLNKTDYLQAHELGELIEFNRGVIASKLGIPPADVRLYPLSARMSLISKQSGNFQEFERALYDFILAGKGAFVLSSASSKVRFVANELRNRLLVEKSSLAVSREELESRIAKFEKELQKILTEKEYNSELIAIEQKKVLEMVDEDIEELKRSLRPRLIDDILAYAKSLENRGNFQYALSVERYMSEKILEALEPWRTAEEEKVSREFSERMRKYSDSTNEIISKVEALASGLFEVSIESRKTEEKFTLESSFYFKLGKIEEGVMLSMVDVVLPGPLFKSRLLSRLPSDLDEELDRNCGRIRYDFLERLQKSSLDFKWMLDEKVDAAIEGIREANRNARALLIEGRQKVSARINEIDAALARIGRVIETLDGIDSSLGAASG